MLPLLIAGISFFFLAMGAVVFLAMVSRPEPRRFALSGALFVAAFGPCVAALVLFAMLVLVASFLSVTATHTAVNNLFHIFEALGWAYVIVGGICSFIIAAGAAKLHQMVIERLPFVLFRLYATVVVAGIGNVFGWCFIFFFAGRLGSHSVAFAVVILFVLTVAFGAAGYRFAASLWPNEAQPSVASPAVLQ